MSMLVEEPRVMNPRMYKVGSKTKGHGVCSARQRHVARHALSKHGVSSGEGLGAPVVIENTAFALLASRWRGAPNQDHWQRVIACAQCKPCLLSIVHLLLYSLPAVLSHALALISVQAAVLPKRARVGGE